FDGENNLSGQLSHKNGSSNFKSPFIGPLSRLHKIENAEKKYDLLVVLSGPEPQRTVFENLIFSQIQKLNFKSLIVRGITEESEKKQLNENVEMVSYLNARELNEAMNAAGLILSRSGYS